jgi:hypothetical protein
MSLRDCGPHHVLTVALEIVEKNINFDRKASCFVPTRVGGQLIIRYSEPNALVIPSPFPLPRPFSRTADFGEPPPKCTPAPLFYALPARMIGPMVPHSFSSVFTALFELEVRRGPIGKLEGIRSQPRPPGLVIFSQSCPLFF